jgi:hypothetical protein
MKICRSNYEVFFIDFLDGALSQPETIELHRFLEENPDLADELIALKQIALQPDECQYLQKENLKKNENLNGVSNYFDYLCISSLENSLTESEKIDLNSIIAQNESQKQTFSLYQKLKLKHDNSLVYNNKSSLKRVSILKLTYSNFRAVASVAAAITVIFATSSLFVKPLINTNSQVATITDININSKSTEIPLKLIEDDAIVVNTSKEAPHNLKVYSVKETSIQESDDANQTHNVQTEKMEYLASISSIKLNSPAPLNYSHPSFAINHEAQLLVNKENEELPVQSRSREIGVFELAQLGVQRLSNITGGNISLDAEKDNTGRISKVNFETTIFAVSVPIKKK